MKSLKTPVKTKTNFLFGIQIFLGAFGLLLFSLRILPAGLILDETLTAWVIRGDILTTISRSIQYQGQSPLYFLAIDQWTDLFGTSELAFRAFSFIAFCCCIVFLYLIHRRKFSPELSSCGTIIGGTLLLLTVPVLEARPYGLTHAFLIGSYYFFLVWLDNRSTKTRVLNILFLILTIYSHWLYCTVLIVQTLFIFNAKVFDKRRLIQQWVINLIVISILCSPNVYQILLIWEKRFVYNYLLEVNLFDWALITMPFYAIVLIVSPVIRLIVTKKIFCMAKEDNLFWFGLFWMIIPPTTLFILSNMSVSILSARYSGHICGIALVITSLLSCMSKPFRRRFYSLSIIILSFILISMAQQDTFSWREPIALLKKLEITNPRPVLLSSGLIESESKEWITDLSKKKYLSAPIQYYLPSLDPILVPKSMSSGLIGFVLSDRMSELQRKGFYLLGGEGIVHINSTLTLSSERHKKFFLDKSFVFVSEQKFSGVYLMQFDPQ